MCMAGPATGLSSTDGERDPGGDKGASGPPCPVLERPNTRFAVKCGDYFFHEEWMPQPQDLTGGELRRQPAPEREGPGGRPA